MHLLRNKKILFASADELNIKEFADSRFWYDTKKLKIPLDKIVGKKVILEISSLEPPYKKEMIIVTNINGAHQVTVLADLRDETEF